MIPVCGEDGNIYDNKCLMECAGVKAGDGTCATYGNGVFWRKNTTVPNHIIKPNSIKLSVNQDYNSIE